VASQNAQQKPDGNFYSYSRYDVQGRMIQTGKMQSNLITPAKARDFEQWSTFIDGLTTRSEITQTQYDRSWSPLTKYLFQNNMQENLRRRVASVLKFDTQQDFKSNSYSHATHYTYDIAGNVKELIQDFKNGVIGAKSIAYDFDLQSGKVNEVIYQAGMPDQFIHRYSYDAANRLTQVETTRDRILWETDATYLYYRHGPLARMELGSDKVQGPRLHLYFARLDQGCEWHD
jgi:YD repeat-containing protein